MAKKLTTTTKLYLVSAKNGEFVAFTDRGDAKYAATGDHGTCFGVSTLADAFRDSYGEGTDEDDGEDCVVLPVIEIELTPAQMKLAKVKVKP